MQDFLGYKHKIKSINYDNGLTTAYQEEVIALGSLSIYSPNYKQPIQTLTIDFGDCEFEIVGKVTWKTKEAPQA